MMGTRSRFVVCAAAIVALLAISDSASAQVTYTGIDNGASSASEIPNSRTAAGNFDANALNATIVDFEAAIPAGLTITGGNVVTNIGPGCTFLCGFNTTENGSNFLYLQAEPVTFTFTSSINAFGFYVTGAQSADFSAIGQGTVSFNDGSMQTIDVPLAGGGGGFFFGLLNPGPANILSFTFDPRLDFVGVDDVRFGVANTSSVPEPSAWALFLLGFGAIGISLRRARHPSAHFNIAELAAIVALARSIIPIGLVGLLLSSVGR